jgi:N-acetylglucosamine kinase-like BadF-type ATPase
VYDGNKSSIAKLSLFIAELAIEGDLDAKKLFVDEGKHLARQTFTAFKKLNTKERILIGIKGGFLLNAPFVKETLIAELDKQKLDYEISKDEVDPVIGAYYLSLKKISVR